MGQLKDLFDAVDELRKKLEEFEHRLNDVSPKLGDVVLCEANGCDSFKAVYLHKALYPTIYWVLRKDKERIQILNDVWKLTKTGEHLDIQGFLDKYC